MNTGISSDFNLLTNPYVEFFNSMSGSDITAIFGNVEVVNLQGISVSVNREIHPIYVMGHPDPRSFTRGKRGVAGSIVMICNDRGALYDIAEQYGVYAKKNGDSHVPGRNVSQDRDASGAFVNALSELDRLGFTLATPHYYDQLPPFDVTLVGRGETLAVSVSRVGGIYIVSLGTGMSVDDSSIEQQLTYVALYYDDWRPMGRRNWQDVQRAATNESYNAFTAPQGVSPFNAAANVGSDVLGQVAGLTPKAGDA